MQTYVLTIDCDCGGDMEVRVGDLTADPNSEPRINVDMALSQTTFVCADCGVRCHTADLADICFGDDNL